MTNPQNLVPADIETVKKEILPTSNVPATGVPATTSLNEEQAATAFVDAACNMNPEDFAQKQAGRKSAEEFGEEAVTAAKKASNMLQQPIRKLFAGTAEGGPVAKSLIDLKMSVEELDPGKFDFEAGWFSRTMGKIPGIGTPLKRYFSKFESAQTTIEAIIRSLQQGKEQLKRDNITLREDQKRWLETAAMLQQQINLGQAVDSKLQYRLERDLASDEKKQQFIKEEILFPLRQRLIDLQQHLAVTQQGAIAGELLARNNNELIRGVDRALNVTVTALKVAATVALALANQKLVLDKVQEINKTTSDLIAGTAARLKTQGTAIHQQAASAQLDMNSLKTAFQDLRTALDDVSKFRQQALPQMAASIQELDRLNADTKATIDKMQHGNQASAMTAKQMQETTVDGEIVTQALKGQPS